MSSAFFVGVGPLLFDARPHKQRTTTAGAGIMAVINSTSGNDSKVGTAGNDTITLFAGNDQGYGEAGSYVEVVSIVEHRAASAERELVEAAALQDCDLAT